MASVPISVSPNLLSLQGEFHVNCTLLISRPISTRLDTGRVPLTGRSSNFHCGDLTNDACLGNWTSPISTPTCAPLSFDKLPLSPSFLGENEELLLKARNQRRHAIVTCFVYLANHVSDVSNMCSHKRSNLANDAMAFRI